MNKHILFSLLSFMLLISACKDKKDEDPQPTEIKEEIIEIKTSFGTMYMWLNKKTPLHRNNFIKLTNDGLFDGTIFHRCVTNFVIQGGDPNTKDTIPGNDGLGGPGYKIDAEINVNNYTHEFGAVGAARDNNPLKQSNGSQFYIVTQTGGSPGLNNNYTVFGKIIKGMDVALEINKQPKVSDVPKSKIVMDVNLLLKTHQEITNEYGFGDFNW